MDGLSKYPVTEMLRCEDSVEKVDGLLTRQVGKFMLKGEAQAIVVYELSGRIDELMRTGKSRARFPDAFAAFRKQS